MARSLRDMAEELAEYLDDSLSVADVLDALASLGLTLVEDPIGDSSITYFELLSEPRSLSPGDRRNT
ncbi:MAG: hypothetical protein ACREQY_16465 [Candidatus Binatia bacterium]